MISLIAVMPVPRDIPKALDVDIQDAGVMPNANQAMLCHRLIRRFPHQKVPIWFCVDEFTVGAISDMPFWQALPTPLRERIGIGHAGFTHDQNLFRELPLRSRAISGTGGTV
jgi:hypothetical protein